MGSERESRDAPPKALWEVLQEEFVALGGEIPNGGPGNAPMGAADPAEAGRQLEAILRLVHARNRASIEDRRTRPRSALCISGGGIRSATFNLGVLQRLVELRLIDQFDYVSTVSGGGYLGSWLGAWIHRADRGLARVVEEMRRSCGRGSGRSAVEPEAAPLRHLRTFSRYLSPRIAILSADTWTLATIYLRNLLVNWTVLVPLLLAALMVPRILVAVIARDPLAQFVDAIGAASDAWAWSPLLIGLLSAAVGFAYAGRHQPSARRRAARRRDERPDAIPRYGQAKFLAGCWAPFLAAALLVSTYWGWRRSGAPEGGTGMGMVAIGAGLGFVGWAFLMFQERRPYWLRELLAVTAGGAIAGVGMWGSAALLAAVAPIAPASPVGAWSAEQGRHFAAFVTLAVPLVLLSLSIGGTIYIGLVSPIPTSSDDDREWWARCGGWLLIATAVWLTAGAVTLFGPGLLLWMSQEAGTTLTTIGGASGLVSILLGRSADTEGGGRKGSEGFVGALKRWALALAAPLFLSLLLAAAALATSGLVASCLPESSDAPLCHYEVLANATPTLVVSWFLAFALLGLAMSRIVDLNRFSMHAMYRDRLVRAYLGASRGAARAPDEFTGFDPADNLPMFELRPEMLRASDVPAGLVGALKRASLARKKKGKGNTKGTEPEQQETPSGADAAAERLFPLLPDDAQRELEALTDAARPLPDDSRLLAGLNRVLAGAKLDAAGEGDLSRSSLRNRAWLEESLGGTKSSPVSLAPLHVVNVALNLVSGDDPAWQERKAESLTISPLHCGSSNLGYRDARDYGGRDGITLGTAMTISGAAVSPNMGYHSSPFVAFLLTLFNVRLGWWLGNPGPAGRRTWRLANPLFAIQPIFAEAFGLTDACHSYVYLSDGGHFENLGVYEMVRRRCRFIVLGDAGADPACSFEDLGNAIRKIRIDFGIPITFPKPLAIVARDALKKKKASYWAIAEIDYAAVDGPAAVPGRLLYLKPAFYGRDEPKDVYTYAQGSETFPHEATSDQFFSESQFESYRALGYHAMTQATLGLDAEARNDLRDLFEKLGPDAETPPASPSTPDS
jgi:hypothetical protein